MGGLPTIHQHPGWLVRQTRGIEGFLDGRVLVDLDDAAIAREAERARSACPSSVRSSLRGRAVQCTDLAAVGSDSNRVDRLSPQARSLRATPPCSRALRHALFASRNPVPTRLPSRRSPGGRTSGVRSRFPAAQHSLYSLRTTPTFSCDIAYSRSPAASRAAAASQWSARRTTFPASKVHTVAVSAVTAAPLPLPLRCDARGYHDVWPGLDEVRRLCTEVVPGGERFLPRLRHLLDAARSVSAGPVDHVELHGRIEGIARGEIARGTTPRTRAVSPPRSPATSPAQYPAGILRCWRGWASPT